MSTFLPYKAVCSCVVHRFARFEFATREEATEAVRLMRRHRISRGSPCDFKVREKSAKEKTLNLFG